MGVDLSSFLLYVVKLKNNLSASEEIKSRTLTDIAGLQGKLGLGAEPVLSKATGVASVGAYVSWEHFVDFQSSYIHKHTHEIIGI